MKLHEASLKKAGFPAAHSTSLPVAHPWPEVLAAKMKEWLGAGMSAPEVMKAKDKLHAEWVKAQDWPAMPAREG